MDILCTEVRSIYCKHIHNKILAHSSNIKRTISAEVDLTKYRDILK